MNDELKNQKITISKKAASRLKNIIENEESGSKGIRVTIDTGGCSGMSYKITFESEKQEFDKVFDSHGISIFCDLHGHNKMENYVPKYKKREERGNNE